MQESIKKAETERILCKGKLRIKGREGGRK